MVVVVVVEEAGNSIECHRESHVKEPHEEEKAIRSLPEGPYEMRMTVGMKDEEVGDSKKEPEDSMKLTDVEGG